MKSGRLALTIAAALAWITWGAITLRTLTGGPDPVELRSGAFLAGVLLSGLVISIGKRPRA